MKIFYYKSTLEEFKNDTKKCWTVLKQAIGKINDKSGYPLIFNINNTKISDQNKIAEGFNNFFSVIGLHTSVVYIIQSLSIIRQVSYTMFIHMCFVH